MTSVEKLYGSCFIVLTFMFKSATMLRVYVFVVR